MERQNIQSDERADEYYREHSKSLEKSKRRRSREDRRKDTQQINSSGSWVTLNRNSFKLSTGFALNCL